MDYQHIRCQCGGILGKYSKEDSFTCERCGKEFLLYKIEYDRLFINNKTGWLFPMKKKLEVFKNVED